MPMFTKKPVTIEARQATGTPESNAEIIKWTKGSDTPAEMLRWTVGLEDGSVLPDTDPTLTIQTLEGPHKVSPGDWVIKGVRGEFYPCKPGIFEATYDEA